MPTANYSAVGAADSSNASENSVSWIKSNKWRLAAVAAFVVVVVVVVPTSVVLTQFRNSSTAGPSYPQLLTSSQTGVGLSSAAPGVRVMQSQAGCAFAQYDHTGVLVLYYTADAESPGGVIKWSSTAAPFTPSTNTTQIFNLKMYPDGQIMTTTNDGQAVLWSNNVSMPGSGPFRLGIYCNSTGYASFVEVDASDRVVWMSDQAAVVPANSTQGSVQQLPVVYSAAHITLPPASRGGDIAVSRSANVSANVSTNSTAASPPAPAMSNSTLSLMPNATTASISNITSVNGQYPRDWLPTPAGLATITFDSTIDPPDDANSTNITTNGTAASPSPSPIPSPSNSTDLNTTSIWDTLIKPSADDANSSSNSIFSSAAISWPQDFVPPMALPHDIVYINNDKIKAGFDRAQGGALCFFSTAKTGWDKNLVNAWDMGRLVQQSYYGNPDGSVWTMDTGTQPWKWNPVQGGSWNHQPGQLVGHNIDSGSSCFSSHSHPRHWASQQLLNDVDMWQKTCLKGSVLKVAFAMKYSGGMYHDATHQEMPAVFLWRGFNRVVTYRGSRPWKRDRRLHSYEPGWVNGPLPIHQAATENWAAWMKTDEGWGVGVYFPHASGFVSYGYGPPSQWWQQYTSSYLAPVATMQIKSGDTVAYNAYLIMGTLTEIRATVYNIRANPSKYL